MHKFCANTDAQSDENRFSANNSLPSFGGDNVTLNSTIVSYRIVRSKMEKIYFAAH